MTPSEKAKELYDKFDGYKCYAIESVNDTIATLSDLYDTYDHASVDKYNRMDIKDWYIKVKQELEK